MKKALPAFLALCGLAALAYLTRPAPFPLLKALPGNRPAAIPSAPGAFGLKNGAAESLPPAFSIGGARIVPRPWSDAVAPDLSRSAASASPDGRFFRVLGTENARQDAWSVLEQEAAGRRGPFSFKERRSSSKRPTSSAHGSERPEGSRRPRRRSFARGPLSGYYKGRKLRPSRAARPFHDIDAKKRLLLSWVRSGGKSLGKTEDPTRRDSADGHRALKKGAVARADSLEKSYRAAQKKARDLARRFRLARARHSREPRAAPSKLLGPKPIAAPKSNPEPPAVNPWSRGIPQSPDGQAASPGLPVEDIEGVLPPPKISGHTKDQGASWMTDGQAVYWRQGSAAGVSVNGRWGWMVQKGGRWWLYPSQGGQPLFRSGGHWWTSEQGAPLLYHDGQALGSSALAQWRQENGGGKTTPGIRYSQDLKRMEIISPKGREFFDPATGRPLIQPPSKEKPQ